MTRRIAIVSQVIRKEDGQGRINYELAQELASRGHAVLLIASDISAGLLQNPAVRVARLHLRWLPTYLLRDQAFALLSTIVLARRRHDLDVVVVNGFVTWSSSDVNLVHFVHRAWLASPAHPARGALDAAAIYRWLYTRLNVAFERFGFRRTRAIVAVSPLVRRQLLECGIPDERISIIANGVDLEVFCPGPGDRTPFGLPENAFVAMFAGDLRTSRKNLDSVLKAVALTPDVHLAVAGQLGGSPFPDLVRRLGVAERIHFLGLRSDIAELMRSCDAFVFPSRFEPFGLVLLEASACGLPVITARTAGACEALSGDGMIVLDDPDDVVGLARALRALQVDPELRSRMGASARAAALRCSWQVSAARYSRVVESVMSCAGAAP
jgi:glycosyltransferase involved in cell wall biosynthesis